MGTGTDVAMESAAVMLVKGDILGIAKARRLSQLTMYNIRQNLFFAFVYNTLGVPIAAGALYPGFGLLLNPMVLAAAMSLSSVSVIATVISGFGAYSYIKVSNKYPSAVGIAMISQKAFGPVTVTGAAALLMAFSMIINESLVARTFGTCTLHWFDGDAYTLWVLVLVLAMALVVFAFVVNILGNKIIGNLSKVTFL